MQLGRLKAFVARGVEELLARCDRIPQTKSEIFPTIISIESKYKKIAACSLMPPNL